MGGRSVEGASIDTHEISQLSAQCIARKLLRQRCREMSREITALISTVVF